MGVIHELENCTWSLAYVDLTGDFATVFQRHKVPAGDARLAVAGEWIEKNQKRNNGGKGGHVKQSPVVEQELDQHHATEGVLSPDQDSVESLQGEEQGAETGATMATTA